MEHKYIAVDDAGVDICQAVFDTKNEANEAASDAWNQLTVEEQNHRHVYVTDVFGSDLEPAAFRDFVDDDIVYWNAYMQSGYDTINCFDSEDLHDK